MNQNESAAEHLGRILDRALGEPIPDEVDVHDCTQAVYRAMEQKPRFHTGRAVPFAAAAAVLIAIGIAWAGFEHAKTAPIGFRIGEGLAHTSNTGWVRNNAPKDLPIRFDNGSLFLLGRRGEAKVVEADRRLVRIDLRNGTMSAEVKGNGHTEWVVEAGPYRVKVLGTEFKVTWQEDSHFSVSVTRGRVSVEGEGVKEGVVLAAGQTLVSSGQNVQIMKTAEMSKALASPHETAAAADTPFPVLQTTELPSPPPSSSDTDAIGAHPLGVPKTPASIPAPAAAASKDSDAREVEPWRAAVREAAWAKAVGLMSDEDFHEVKETADLNELWHLADAARRNRRIDAASALFVAIRNRFQGTDRAAVSAFLLGKIALDTGGKPKDAVRRLRTYLDEAPDGELAEEALGRLMEAYRALGRPAEASTCARDYLSRFPKGTYSGEAAALAGE